VSKPGGFQELRTEVRDGFRSVNGRLDAHDRRFDTIDQHLREHSDTLRDDTHRLDRIERKLDSTIGRVDYHSVRLERLEKRQRSRTALIALGRQ
jgi:tetrahydromethanopterin S-methyltransferase subunit G